MAVKIDDRVMLGMVSGVLAGIPDTVINMLEHKAGLTDPTYGRMGANIFTSRDKADRPESLVAGYAANAAMTGMVGILFSYLLSLTGRDHPVLKGIGMGLGTWILFYGLGGNLGLLAKHRKPRAPLLSLFDHILFGSLLGLLTTKLAGDEVFKGEAPARATNARNNFNNDDQTPVYLQ